MNIPAVVRALSGALVLGMGGCSSLAAGSSAGDLGLVQDAMRQVESSYVVPVGPDKLVNGALKGMLSKLDPHSDYMTETEYRELMATTSGHAIARAIDYIRNGAADGHDERPVRRHRHRGFGRRGRAAGRLCDRRNPRRGGGDRARRPHRQGGWRCDRRYGYR